MLSQTLVEGFAGSYAHRRTRRLDESDPAIFDADHDHSYKCADPKHCRAIVVVSNNTAV